MEIKNEVISNVFLLWAIVGFFGFLISTVLVLIVYFILVPISIPFSIRNILNNLKNKDK